MSRQRIAMTDGTMLVIGYDPAYNTWYAQHFDDHDENKPPRVAVGYHPDEQAILLAERPDAIVGPYPVGDDEVERMLTEAIPDLMGIAPDPDQPGCWRCGLPPWQPNPDCGAHPFDRLRRS